MTSIITLQRDVAEIKQRVNPEDQHFIINMSFGSDSEPHGFLGGNSLHIVIKQGKETKWVEAWTTETDLESNRKYYEDMIANPKSNFTVNPDHPFHSFESFVEYHRCRCGKHGEDGRQTFMGDGQNG